MMHGEKNIKLAYSIFFPVRSQYSTHHPALKCVWTVRYEVLTAVKARTLKFRIIQSLHFEF